MTDLDLIRERMDGGYTPPILAEPATERPVPAWDPATAPTGD